jgi:hypothetical protein
MDMYLTTCMHGMHAGVDKAIGFWSDVTSIKLEVAEKQFATRPPDPLTAVPAQDPENPGFPLFLTAQDPWFVAMQAVRGRLLALHLCAIVVVG